MKLLLDQNISFRLVKKFESAFPGTQQVRGLRLENASDKAIWDYAKREGFAIVSFDSDFYDLSVTYGHPPKVIWIKSINQTTSHLEELLIEKFEQIQQFELDEEVSCLEIGG